MSSEQRAIILKNDDSSITYVGNWTTVQANTVNSFGNFGLALSLRLHSTSVIGSSISVFGSINIANFSTNPNPTWKCSVDGISLGPPNLSQFPQNNWPLCSLDTIPDGSHQLVVNVTSEGMPFYLDYIEYRPSANVSLENSLIEINNNDPAIDYISGWTNLGSTANQTTNPDGLINVTFVGTRLSWYGLRPIEESHNASSGEYSIDGGAPTSFKLFGFSPTGTNTTFNRRFFITPILEMGKHVLSAKYTGSPGQTPLTLDYLIVAMNGSLPSSSGGTNGTGTPSSNPLPNGNPLNDVKKSSSNIGAFVGGCVGGFLGLMVIFLFIWFKFYRKRGQGRFPRGFGGIMPFYIHDQDRSLPILSPSSPAFAPPPLQINEISKHRTQHIPQQHSVTLVNALSSQPSTPNLNNITTTPLYTNDASHSGAGSPPVVSSLRTSVQRPLPPAPALVPLGEDAAQHVDSGIRLGRGNGIPPSYTEL